MEQETKQQKKRPMVNVPFRMEEDFIELLSRVVEHESLERPNVDPQLVLAESVASHFPYSRQMFREIREERLYGVKIPVRVEGKLNAS